ncbi:hypothetical protein ABG067_007311 [Albugo candida]
MLAKRLPKPLTMPKKPQNQKKKKQKKQKKQKKGQKFGKIEVQIAKETSPNPIRQGKFSIEGRSISVALYILKFGEKKKYASIPNEFFTELEID